MSHRGARAAPGLDLREADSSVSPAGGAAHDDATLVAEVGATADNIGDGEFRQATSQSVRTAADFLFGAANAEPSSRVRSSVRSNWNGGAALAMLTADDENLALGVHRCSPGAFDQLVVRYEPSLFNYANRILGNAFDAQEVVQDAFLRAHQAITRQYDEGRIAELTLKPWLFRIVRNLSFNKKRGGASKLDEPLAAFDDGRIGPLVPACSVSAGIERQQERAALDRAIASLPEESRELIVLRFMEEMSYAEMAGIIGQGEAALRGRVFRSLKMLREALAEREVHHAV